MGKIQTISMAPSSSLLTASILLIVMFASADSTADTSWYSCHRAFKDSLKHGYRVPPLVVKDSYGYRYMSLVDEVIPETKLVQAAERPATPATDMVEPTAGPAKEEALVSETTSESTEDLVESVDACDPCDEMIDGCCGIWRLNSEIQ